MCKKQLVGLALIFTVLALCNVKPAFAAGSRVNISPTSLSLVKDTPATVQISLDEPVICEDPDVTCNVAFDFTTSDPSRVSVSPSIVTIPANEWSEPQDITINSVDSDVFNNGETVTISSSPLVSASEYYSGFQPSSISVTLPQASPPLLKSKTVSVVSNGQAVPVNVLAGANGNPDPSSLSIVSGPSHGTAVDPPGTITYTATNGYSGTDSLTYRVCSSLESSVCGTAKLIFSVSAPIGTPNTGFGLYNYRHSATIILELLAVLVIGSGLVILSKSFR